MFINTIQSFQGIQNIYQNKMHSQDNKINYAKNINQSDVVSFSGYKPNEEIIKNQYRIMLTQDIWADKLDVKMPESDVEKEILLEVLTQRKKLDRYTRLTNEKTRIMADLHRYNMLKNNDSSNPEIKDLRTSLGKKGNLESAISTLNKNIQLEKNKNIQAFEYFKNIEKLEDEYLNSHKIKINAISKFWAQVRKHNINTEHKYSTQDLIDIISNTKPVSELSAGQNKKPVETNLNRKQVLANAYKEYEQFLRENVNIYIVDRQWKDAQAGRKFIYKLNEKYINKYAGLDKQLLKVFADVQRKYGFKTDCLGSLDIYPIGEVLLEMNKGVVEMREKSAEINDIHERLATASKDKTLNEALVKAEKELNAIKKLWIDALKLSMIYERKNREIFADNGRMDAYDYLTSENKELLCYKKLEKICDENNGTLPEDLWDELIAG